VNGFCELVFERTGAHLSMWIALAATLALAVIR
jgi:hypothetical protein